MAASGMPVAVTAPSTVAQELPACGLIRTHFRKCMKVFGCATIIDGLLSIILSSVMISLNGVFVTDYSGSGVWSGLFFIATGFCGLNTFSDATTDMIAITMVMSFFSVFLASVTIGVNSNALGIQRSDDTHGGFKAGGGLLISFGVAEIALSVFSLAVCIVFLCQGRHEASQSKLDSSGSRSYGGCSNGISAATSAEGGQIAATEVTNNPFPFSTMEHLKSIKWMGIWQCIVGMACIILSSITVSQGRGIDVGVGIWCGIIFAVNGCLAFFAASARSKRLTVATLVLSILNSSLLVNMFIWPSINLNDFSRFLWCNKEFCKQYSELSTAHGLLVVLGIAEVIMSVWCTVVCSLAVCRSGCCLCCVPQVVLHIQDGDMQLQATQGASRLVAVTETARAYTAGSQIHVEIRLTTDNVQKRT